MDRETGLLMQLAERPDDRALRLVFADWLQEAGDPRGELIALCARGELSLTEQRKIARVTLKHAGEWLGPLAAIADLFRTRFHDGFLSELVTAPTLGVQPANELEVKLSTVFDSLVGEPRLATCRALSVPPTGELPSGLERFLAHRFLGRVERLELGQLDWHSLRDLPLPHLRPTRVVVASWGAFEDELRGLEKVEVFARAQNLTLSTTDFTNSPIVQRIVGSVGAQLQAMKHFTEVRLHSHYGPVEGSADWLIAGDEAATVLPKLEAWSLEASEVGFLRVRGDDRRLSHLVVDLSLPEATVAERQATTSGGRPPMVVRLQTAAMVMSLLRGKGIHSVEIKLAAGARLRSTERHTLFTEARRWGTLHKFVIGDETTILP